MIIISACWKELPSQVVLVLKNPPVKKEKKKKRTRLSIRETQVRSLGQEDPPKEVRATHSGILAWKTPWSEEPDGL